jgi:O-antigen/teichoic acid export membrane protein
LPSLIAAGQAPDQTAFRSLERRFQIEIAGWTVLLASGTAIAVPLLLPLLNQPLAQEHLPVFWLILFATVLRIAADFYGFVLLSLNRDRAIAWVAAGGALASAALNLLLIPTFGLMGAGAAYAVTSGGLFLARYVFSRPGTLAMRQSRVKG